MSSSDLFVVEIENHHSKKKKKQTLYLPSIFLFYTFFWVLITSSGWVDVGEGRWCRSQTYIATTQLLLAVCVRLTLEKWSGRAVTGNRCWEADSQRVKRISRWAAALSAAAVILAFSGVLLLLTGCHFQLWHVTPPWVPEVRMQFVWAG